MNRLFTTALLIVGLASADQALAVVEKSLSLKQAMTQFGLIGEWAADCGQPPSGKNAHTHWSANSDSAGALLTDFGGGQKMTYTASAAEILGADQIRVDLTDDRDHQGLELIIQKKDGRMRTLSSVGSDGNPLIKNGKFISDGTDSVAQAHCS